MRKLLSSIIFCTTCSMALAQSVGISTNSPSNGALLELKSSDKGLLLPRLTTHARIQCKAENGMLVFNTDKQALYIFESGIWQALNVGNSQSEKKPDQEIPSSSLGPTRSASALAMMKEYLAVGAPGTDNNPSINTSTNEGAVYLFKRGTTGTLWGAYQKLAVSGLQQGGLLGYAVDANGDRLVVKIGNMVNVGIAYYFIQNIFKFSIPSPWQQAGAAFGSVLITDKDYPNYEPTIWISAPGCTVGGGFLKFLSNYPDPVIISKVENKLKS